MTELVDTKHSSVRRSQRSPTLRRILIHRAEESEVTDRDRKSVVCQTPIQKKKREKKPGRGHRGNESGDGNLLLHLRLLALLLLPVSISYLFGP